MKELSLQKVLLTNRHQQVEGLLDARNGPDIDTAHSPTHDLRSDWAVSCTTILASFVTAPRMSLRPSSDGSTIHHTFDGRPLSMKILTSRAKVGVSPHLVTVRSSPPSSVSRSSSSWFVLTLSLSQIPRKGNLCLAQFDHTFKNQGVVPVD